MDKKSRFLLALSILCMIGVFAAVETQVRVVGLIGGLGALSLILAFEAGGQTVRGGRNEVPPPN